MKTSTSSPKSVVILSGPGGVGKGTIVQTLLDQLPHNSRVGVALSATTREPRSGESHGVHYLFLSDKEFQAMIDSGAFLEWAQFGRNRYGTPWKSITHADVDILILEIDCQGARQLLENPERLEGIPVTSVFIAPPSWEELETRLRRRATDTEEQIAHRLRVGKDEVAMQTMFDNVIVNDDLATSVQAVKALINVS